MLRTTHTFTQGDLFYAYDLKKLKFKTESGNKREMKSIYKYGDKNELVAKIFLTLMKLITEDMMVNGSTFHLPTKTIAMFTWKKLQGERFIKAYQSGKFTDFDYLLTDFTIYVPIFKYYFRERFREKIFVINEDMRKIVSDRANSGYKYC